MGCSAIIVTHNSARFMHATMTALIQQTRPVDHIIIIDSASDDPSYLFLYKQHKNVEIHLQKDNIGFSKANNIGVEIVAKRSDYILFLNPDAFLTAEFIEQALAFMNQPEQIRIGAITGTLLGYDIEKQQPNGKYDSTGVFRSFYGRWFDRDQGIDSHLYSYTMVEKIPAICGAVMFCRRIALEEVDLGSNEVFDSKFFMYKEDIDLSYRLRQAHWELLFIPSLKAYHCRGWQRDRSKVPRKLRLCAAKNEIRLHARMRSVYLLTSLLKYAAVKFLDV